jgi:hypothetical protein
MDDTREIKTESDYNFLVSTNKIPVAGTEDDIATRRLEKILDIRKFEIDLYWKRATYFWAFIAASLTGYGLTMLSDTKNTDGVLKFQFIIICLGLIFSLAWYLVNKGSKFWQENWEKHLDLTEDKVIGPLYKTTISKETYSSFWNPTKAYAVSVSKVNQILSLFIFLIWLSIMFHFVFENLSLFYTLKLYYTLIAFITIAATLYLLLGTGTGIKDTIVHFYRRKVTDKN